jgi:peptidoglycan L-alanyl-D-glutamate endopeptidase CwlK
VHPDLQKVMHRALKLSPIDFGIPSKGGYRTFEMQRELYEQGRTKPGKIITKADGRMKKSKHQSGKAVDVYAYINGKASWDEVHLSMIAVAVMLAAKELNIKITWGGIFGSKEFKGWDKEHYQLKH